MFLKSSNLFSAVALRVARVCNKPDALTQLTEIIGSSVSDQDLYMSGGSGSPPTPPPPTAADADIWREKFSGVVPIDRLDKLRMLKINQQTGYVWHFLFVSINVDILVFQVVPR